MRLGRRRSDPKSAQERLLGLEQDPGAATIAPLWDRGWACRRTHVGTSTAGEAGTVQTPGAGGPVGGQRLRGRTASRVAIAGITGVLLVLTGFALWAASSTNQAALHAAELTH